MQNSSKSKSITVLIVVAITLIACVWRTLLMLFGFDYDTHFFYNNTIATVMYIFVLLSGAIAYYFSKKIDTGKVDNSRCDSTCEILYTILNVLSAVIFATLFYSASTTPLPQMTLGRVTHWVALVSSAFSTIYFLLAVFDKKVNSSIITCFNIAPIIYLLCLSIDCFTSFSTKANSYYLFPHVISIIFLAFYILNKARNNYVAQEQKSSILPYSLIALLFLTFSFVPDVVILLNERMSFSLIDLLITVFKGIYIIISITDIHASAKAKNEEK